VSEEGDEGQLIGNEQEQQQNAKREEEEQQFNRFKIRAKGQTEMVIRYNTERES
jgi:hypothetical protein